MPDSRPAKRLTTIVAAAAAVCASLVPTATSAPGGPPRNVFTGTDRVIVQAVTADIARDAVERAGGRVRIDLPIVDGVAADVPRDAMPALARMLGVRAITADDRMTVQGAIDLEPESAERPTSVYPEVVRANELALRGGTGAGITVALLDTGISETPDLAGRILSIEDEFGIDRPCVNLSGEPTCGDSYGHGTFLAGIIAGDGAASNGEYVGVAPEANLVSIKVGGRHGSADASNVLAGIQWAVSFRDRYDIRVLNLSLGTDSTQKWTVSPLNYAVERAWRAGIVVVVAASNRGPDPGTISKPADDPYVITVGATDDLTTVDLADDVLPDFSARGPAPEGVAKPDVVAPGGHIVSLRAIGSAIDTEFPEGIDETYRQGSGTSMSAAVVSGVVAAILSLRPNRTPDRLKYALVETGRSVAVDDPDAVGSGMVDALAAGVHPPKGRANQGLSRSSGLGGLDPSRGSVLVSLDDLGGLVLNGLLTAQLLLWDVLSFRGAWTETSWKLTNLARFPWYVTSWYGSTWEGHNWEGCTWGDTYQEDCYYGHNWEGSTWYGAWD